MNTRRLVLATVLAAAVAAPSAASAATPETGSVSFAAPNFKWNGSTTNGGATTISSIQNGGTYACVAPSCDTFTLTVADAGGDLKITVNNGSNGFLMVEVVKPDGSTIYNGGAEGEPKTVVGIKNAPKGDYEIHVASNSILFETLHNGLAELTKPVAVSEEPAPPQTGDQPAPQPAPAEAPAANVSLKAGKLSARKIARAKRLGLTIAADKPVSDVVVSLFKGKKRLATGKLASLSGSKAMSLKVARKLKAGSYVLTASAKDGSRVVGARMTVKVAK